MVQLVATPPFGRGGWVGGCEEGVEGWWWVVE